MFGVMLLTLFEWWRMRRRFVALAAMTDALSRLDYKYKAMFAKAELRLQQLYGRRRGGITEGQPRPKMPEEVEIERLNEELKQILELHLQRMGARLPGCAPQGMARDVRWRRRWLDRRSTSVSTLDLRLSHLKELHPAVHARCRGSTPVARHAGDCI